MFYVTETITGGPDVSSGVTSINRVLVEEELHDLGGRTKKTET